MKPHRVHNKARAVAAICVLSLGSCKPPPQEADPRTQARLVDVTTVRAGVDMGRSFTGIVTARVQSDVGFRVGGKVIERLVDVGQSVRSGQLLMRLDPTDLAHAITAQTALVTAAKARALQAAAEEMRNRLLVPSGAASRSQYDQARAAADSARAQLAAAQAQARSVEDDGKYSVLLADADGTIVETLAEPGQVVAAGQIVLRLAHAGAREAAVDLPETLRPAIGSIAAATVFGDERHPATATLRQIADAADTRTRTFDARYVLGGRLASAKLGATVTVLIRNGEMPASSVTVPLSALNDEGTGASVWVLDRQRSIVRFRPVQLAALGEEDATVSAGLHTGETVVALGARLLHDGEAVRVASTDITLR